MNKFFKVLFATAVVAFVASCGGGGGDAGTSPFGGGGTGGGATKAADLILTVSSAQIPNTGSSSATVTATAIDASRNALSGIPVSISADGNAVLSTSGTTTGTDGTLSAKLSIGSDRGNRLITVTATAGSISKTATVQVVGTTITSVLVPAVIAPAASGEVQYHVVDQAGNPMSDQTVQIVAPNLTPSG